MSRRIDKDKTWYVPFNQSMAHPGAIHPNNMLNGILQSNFDDFFENSKSNYPPYNIIKDGDNYVIEVACSGFSKENLIAQLVGSALVITGNPKKQKEDVVYLKKGISSKNFILKFALSETAEVENVSFVDGLLSVEIKDIKKEVNKLLTIH